MASRRYEIALLLLGLIGLFAACILVQPLREALSAAIHGDVGALRQQLRSLGISGALILVAIVLAHTIVPFPAEIPSAAAGFVFGFAIALPLMLGSFVASALAGYALADWIGRPLARAIAGERRLRSAELLVGRGGVRTLLLLRVVPFVPFSLMCFVCGLARVPLRRYTWTTAVGMSPQLILLTLVGSRLEHARITDPLLWAPAAGMVLLVALGPMLLRRVRRAA